MGKRVGDRMAPDRRRDAATDKAGVMRP